MGKAIFGFLFTIGLLLNNGLDNLQEVDLFYYEQSNEDIYLVKSKAIIERETTEDMIFNTLKNLLENNNNKVTFIPDYTIVNDVLLLDNEVYIDFSKEILNYGGNMWEQGLTNQILSTVFQFEEVEKVSIFIDGKEENLVEGTIIKGYTRIKWKERL